MIDIHCHVLPRVDDGSINVEMSIEMLKRLKNQGATSVFCTSHSDYIINDVKRYKNIFQQTKQYVKKEIPELNLYLGSEVFCTKYNIHDIVLGIQQGLYLTLNDSRYILTECNVGVKPTEFLFIASVLLNAGYTPVFAHVERYYNIFDNNTIDKIISMGCMLQVNAYSFGDGIYSECGERALLRLNKKQVHFLGSDAHNTTWRPPMIKCGLEYLKENTDSEYFKDISYRNAQKYLLGE